MRKCISIFIRLPPLLLTQYGCKQGTPSNTLNDTLNCIITSLIFLNCNRLLLWDLVQRRINQWVVRISLIQWKTLKGVIFQKWVTAVLP